VVDRNAAEYKKNYFWEKIKSQNNLVKEMLNEKFPMARLKYTIWKMNKEYLLEKEAKRIKRQHDKHSRVPTTV
jgi:hypothetical protein